MNVSSLGGGSDLVPSPGLNPGIDSFPDLWLGLADQRSSVRRRE